MPKRKPRRAGSRRVAHPRTTSLGAKIDPQVQAREFDNPHRVAAHFKHLGELLARPELARAWIPIEDVFTALKADGQQPRREGSVGSRLLPELACEETARRALETFEQMSLDSEDGPMGPDALALMVGAIGMERWLENRSPPERYPLWGYLLNAPIAALACDGAIVTQVRPFDEAAVVRDFAAALGAESVVRELCGLELPLDAHVLASRLRGTLERGRWLEASECWLELDSLLHVLFEVHEFGTTYAMRIASEGLTPEIDQAAEHAFSSALARDLCSDVLEQIAAELKAAASKDARAQQDLEVLLGSLLCVAPLRNPFLRELVARSFEAVRDRSKGDVALIFEVIRGDPTHDGALAVFEQALRAIGPKGARPANRVERYRQWLRLGCGS